MSQLIFDGLGVSLDSQTVQSLLESQGLSSEVSSLGTSSILFDEEDLIQCGKCKKQFNSLTLFMSHKEEHKMGLLYSRLQSGIDDQLSTNQVSKFQLQTLDSDSPIIVQDGTDILSFSIDQNGTFISASGESIGSLSQPLILASELEDGADMLVKGEEPQEGEAKGEKLKCDYCNKVFAKNFDLQQHVRSHTGEKPFQCVVCGRAFSQKSNVKKHMVTHKVWPDGLSRTLPKDPLLRLTEDTTSEETVIVDRSYVCQYCATPYKSYYELKKHMKSHVGRKVYKCIQQGCSETFDELDEFLRHTRQHPDDVAYRCHVCGKQFPTLADLGLHQYSHSAAPSKAHKKTKYFRCVQCKSRFVSPEALEHHKATTSHRYACSHCGKVFSCERYLRRHLPTHGTAHAFVCPSCGKGFRTEQYLNTHRVIHSSEKPFTCEHCPSAFNRKDKLARHLLIHQPTKRFKCPFKTHLGCLKEFNRQDKLKVHLLTHSSQKQIPCGSCDRAFVRSSLLRSPKKVHRKPDAGRYACTRCGAAHKTAALLHAHSCSYPSSRRGRNKRRAVTPDNVPTIEIIVMPVSRTGGQSADSSGMYQVTFPTANQGEDQEVPV